MADETPILPAHIEDTVQAIAKLHADHYARASPLQNLLDATTARAGRPSFIVGVVALAAAWMTLNGAMMAAGLKPLDEPPFFWMQGVVALGALIMTSLILTTQRREDQLATHREQLTLELAILSEQKATKIIQLLEELRRDHPQIVDRVGLELKRSRRRRTPRPCWTRSRTPTRRWWRRRGRQTHRSRRRRPSDEARSRRRAPTGCRSGAYGRRGYGPLSSCAV